MVVRTGDCINADHNSGHTAMLSSFYAHIQWQIVGMSFIVVKYRMNEEDSTLLPSGTPPPPWATRDLIMKPLMTSQGDYICPTQYAI